MKINVQSKTIEIKKKHVYRAVFCGAVGCAIMYRSKYNNLTEEVVKLSVQIAQAKKFAEEVGFHAVDSGVARIEESNGRSALIFNY